MTGLNYFRILFYFLSIFLFSHSTLSQTIELLEPAFLTKKSNPPGYIRIAYGEKEFQFADLRLPDTSGPHPVFIVIHGGCYLAKYDLNYMGEISKSLSDQAYATWNIEYRRVGNKGGGWPGTFLDVADAADYLRHIAPRYNLDLKKVFVIGHSSGGQLAIWLAARDQIKSDSELFRENPLSIHTAAALAPVANIARRFRQENCDNSAAGLMGGSPEEQAERYRQVSPVEMLPIQTPQIIFLGQQDSAARHDETENYLKRAKALGMPVEFVSVPDSGHIDLVVPGTSAWESVNQVLESLN